MTPQPWDDLPRTAQTAMVERCGEVSHVEPESAGVNAALTVTLTTANGRVFAKGTPVDSKHASALRNEALVSPYLPAVAPRLLWTIEVSGWLLCGFEHAAGRHADFAPGSPDLPRVIAAVAGTQRALTPCPPINVGDFADQWARLSPWRRLAEHPPATLDPWTRTHLDLGRSDETEAVERLHGDTLAHTDLQELNFLVGQRVRIIDWGWARRAAPWVDVGFLVIRLISAGHTPEEAESWADRIPAWRDAPERARSLFAVETLGVWEWLLHHRPLPHRARLTEVARQWTRYRLTTSVEQ